MEEDIFNDKRLPGENMILYKIRREENRNARKKLHSAKIYWPSSLAGTLTAKAANEMAEKLLKKEGTITKPGDDGYDELKAKRDELSDKTKVKSMDKPKQKRSKAVAKPRSSGKKNAKKPRQPSSSNS